jgi:hypothetical protein
MALMAGPTFTVIEAVVVAMHPALLKAVTVYVVVELGLADVAAVLVLDRPDVGDQA